MSYQVRDSYLPLILELDALLHSNTDKATDKDPLPAMVGKVVMAADSLSHRPLVLLKAPTRSTFYPYTSPSTIMGSKPQLAD